MKNSGKVESGGKDRVFIRHTIDSHPHHDMPCHWHATTKCMLLRGNQMMGWLVDVMYSLGFGCCGHNACDCMIPLVDCGTIHGTVPIWIIWVCGGMADLLDYLLLTRLKVVQVDHSSQSFSCGVSLNGLLTRGWVGFRKCTQRKVSRAHPELGKWWSVTR